MSWFWKDMSEKADEPYFEAGDVVRLDEVRAMDIPRNSGDFRPYGPRDCKILRPGTLITILDAPKWHALGPHPRPTARYFVLADNEFGYIVISLSRYGATLIA